MKVVDHDRDIQKFELRTSENIKGDTCELSQKNYYVRWLTTCVGFKARSHRAYYAA